MLATYKHLSSALELQRSTEGATASSYSTSAKQAMTAAPDLRLPYHLLLERKRVESRQIDSLIELDELYKRVQLRMARTKFGGVGVVRKSGLRRNDENSQTLPTYCTGGAR